MKANIFTLLLLSALCLNAYAQDDDMYSFSSKKKTQKVSASTGYNTSSEEDTYVDADYHTGDLFDVDEYNRRGKSQQANTPSYQLVGDTLYVSSNGEPLQNESVSYNEGYTNGYYDGLYDGDFCLTSRLYRYRGFRFYLFRFSAGKYPVICCLCFRRLLRRFYFAHFAIVYVAIIRQLFTAVNVHFSPFYV